MWKSMCFVWLMVLLAGMMLMGSCAQDPKIMVTPFVLKAGTPPKAQATSTPEMAPCTRPYEEVIAGGGSGTSN